MITTYSRHLHASASGDLEAAPAPGWSPVTTISALAAAVGLSEAAVRQRVQRLVDSGVMQIVAVTDPLQVGFPRQAMIGIQAEGDLDRRRELAGWTRSTTSSSPPARSTSWSRWSARTTTTCSTLLTSGSAPCRRAHHRVVRLSQAVASRPTPGAPVTVPRRDQPECSAEQTTSTRVGARPRPPLDALHPDVDLQQSDVPVIVRGEGPYIWDDKGRRYLDGLAGLFVVQAGHGRTELAEAAAKQASELSLPLWSNARRTYAPRRPRPTARYARLTRRPPIRVRQQIGASPGGKTLLSVCGDGRQHYRPANAAAEKCPSKRGVLAGGDGVSARADKPPFSVLRNYSGRVRC